VALPAWTPESPSKPSRRWVAASAGGLSVILAIVAVVAWLWPAHPAASSKNEPRVEMKAPLTPEPAPSVAVSTPALASQPSPPVANPLVRVDLDATAPTWVSLADSEGKRLLAELLVPGAPRTFQVTKDATLLTGNAGGLVLRINGRPLGSLGYAGQVRQIQIKDGKMVTSTP
jgi:hypothetical protein